MAALARGLPMQTVYETRFFVTWPEYLGGGTADIEAYGSMVLLPILRTGQPSSDEYTQSAKREQFQ